ncbi:NCS2 family permease [uncultured Georgenia sp.]|uniref:NCS2 family permease n=1 Tax=uncultured Georgenia sp. TaxID=378209 RepID=UPI00263531E4|nr:NCS2 family permease [uncultured Georgenia sp.]HLV03358.1 NCS2 family permease [Actinomycetaceae bacterium]
MSSPAQVRAQDRSWLDRRFQLTERGSTVGREIRGGIVTFFAMSYILVLNPLILSTPDSTGAYLGGGTDGPNFAAVAAGTALVAGIMTILMGAAANFPLALAAGLGLNAVVAYTLVSLPGMTWADAMGIVVLEGILILILVLTGLREAVFKAVPQQLKVAISVGLGLFIALVGLVNAGIVRPGAGTPVQLGVDGSIVGWPAVVFLVGLFLILVLLVKKVRGAILIGVVAATVLAAIIEAVADVGLVAEGDVGGWGLTVPAIEGSIFGVPEFTTLGQFSLFGAVTKIGIVAAALLIFSLMLADFFDTMGTMVAIGSEADLLDKDGNPPRTRAILVVDSIAAAAGGAGGVSSNTSYIESAAGVGDGARTGLSSIVTGIAFLLSIFLAPLAAFVPYEAATPALVVVGFLMMQQVTEINWRDITIAVPAFLTIVLMPFSYSITVGIGAGFIAYVVLSAVRKGGARQVHWLMWVVAALFVVYFALGPIQQALGI